jgi:hypothetical protein
MHHDDDVSMFDGSHGSREKEAQKSGKPSKFCATYRAWVEEIFGSRNKCCHVAMAAKFMARAK